MRIEQIIYFVETIRAGSISTAAKNLFVSQQALSSSLISLEQEMGFPMLIRQKKGVTLTKNGEDFLEYANAFLEKYNDIVNFSHEKSNLYFSKSEHINMVIGPFISKLLIPLLAEKKFISKYNLIISEATISDVLYSFFINKTHLAIFFIQNCNYQKFKKTLPDYLELQELFEDEVIFCMNEKIASSKSGSFFPDSSELYIEFPTSHYDLLGTTLSVSSIFCTDSSIHLKLMKEQDAICASTKKLSQIMYNDPSIITKRINRIESHGKFYIAINKSLLNKSVDMLCTEIQQIIMQNIK